MNEATFEATAAGAVEKTIDVEVRYAETDQMGVVHHGEYVVWFEIARTRLCADSGWHYADIERLGYHLMVTGVELSYRRPARYGETVQVTCSIARLGSRGLTFAYRVERAGELLVRGTTGHVWVDRASSRPCRTPVELEEGFRQLAGGP
ncbi:MAG TPA: thioesterase family protein [Thermoanaerobaculia bacterium]|nr:thioesterase family protein [Thermoanaerobaculia bacterium]